jgi:rhodanese-related sulfurtransferase
MTDRVGYRRIDAVRAADLIVRHRRRVLPELALFDARDRQWFDRGHIQGAEHLDDRSFGRALRDLSTRKPVIVYCSAGDASQMYAAMFARFRFSEVYSVDGGFELLAEALATHYLPPGRSGVNVKGSKALSLFLDEYRFDHFDLDCPREYGLTPLMRAALEGRADLVDELLRLGADLRLRNADGNNVLWLACVANHLPTVLRLIQEGIDLDNANDSGATALMYAASSGKADILALLLQAGADPHLRNQDDFQALDLASTWVCLELLRHAARPPRLARLSPRADGMGLTSAG